MAGNTINDDSLLAGHPRAEFVGGRRVSQPSDHSPLKKDQESTTGEKENDPDKHDMVLQKQLDNEHFKALKESQQHKFLNNNWAAIHKNTEPFNPVKNGKLRQPSQFTKGVPKDFKEAAKGL
ncbi:hypothetical protein COEREDRAFT_87415 [Coemansia reversa NRRL 1564]|uniref:Uncharacterized protein n=1 Tax=Coemansia reversa (strain ATCC 12441 / NRRL 1564) TaxID=763665 RepID=A0A2G5BAA1_COERN|nr:hypothetical protein COEREDRAFT_87415 [Coemansia reversa NRRL 1564]|eukprot:PIA15920.1 hypothetical protein COEREDRAFT_87415 [Coemansia reversa NRRL 1564]